MHAKLTRGLTSAANWPRAAHKITSLSRNSAGRKKGDIAR
jgi:hypothetical protein